MIRTECLASPDVSAVGEELKLGVEVEGGEEL